MAARIDHRSYKEQGIDLIPTIHEGYEVRAMEKKGIKTVIGELNRAIRQFNQMFISLKESIQWMKTAYEEMKSELDRRQNPTLHIPRVWSESSQFPALCKNGDQFWLPYGTPGIFRSPSLSTLFSIPLKVPDHSIR